MRKIIKRHFWYLEPIIESFFNGINHEHSKRFPSMPTKGTKEEYIDLDIHQSSEINEIRIYNVCRGNILIKKTKYEYPQNEIPYRAEITGNPVIQIGYCNLDKINQWNNNPKELMKMFKEAIDKCEKKIIEQGASKLLINVDI